MLLSQKNKNSLKHDRIIKEKVLILIFYLEKGNTNNNNSIYNLFIKCR